ncbi:PAS domain S-box protein [Pedobacter arcticus]|uniref:PAS domain S-box protein n=1 Tax=Pedobacter arcticus TaxID=752140 RepID=UPI0012B525D4|nr:PAS domain S-box protein [Pedobacter arcticus]
MNYVDDNMLDQNPPFKLMEDFGLYEPSSNDQFNDILSLACFITGCSSAYISLIDENWQNIRYTRSFTAGQNPINNSICKLAITERKILQIVDISTNPALINTILPTQQGFKFYVGLPLIDNKGVVLGTLCALHPNTKALDLNQLQNFEIIGKQVLNLLKLRKRNIQKKKSEESADEHKVFFNATDSVICTLSDQLDIKEINNASFDVFGFEPEECIGLNIADFIFPEDRVRVVKLATEKLKNKLKTLDIETRIVTKNNELKWISWNAVTRNRKWFVVGREITQEKEISKNLQHLSTVASKIENGIVISNVKTEVTWVNPAFTTITGYNLSDLSFKRLGDVLAGEETDKELLEKVRYETINNRSSSTEFLAYRKNGEKIWISVHNTPLVDDKGIVESQITIIIDITERKKAEKQLELLSLVASKTNNGVHICDKDGNVTWINEALENILGLKNKDVIGKKLVDLVKGEDTDMDLLEIVREKAKLHEPFNIEHKVYRKDGQPIWLSIANTPIYNTTTKQHTQIEIINDITQRKIAEFQLLAQREETLQLSKAKESFVSIMSHEIRTPLNAVIGLANILHDEEKLPSQEQSINLLKFSADNLLNLINDILDFNKIEVGKMELENKRLDIRALLKDIVASMRFNTNEKPITLAFSVDNQIPGLIRGDKTRLYQILANLINNALKFTEQGNVNVSVTLQPEIQNKVVLNFKVTDTGIGIPEDKLAAIFEPFTQAASNTSRKYGGSGLGLAITQKLIHLFGGDIKVQSKLGIGTEFSFTLNFNKFEGDIVMPETPEKISLAGKILVVDDNEINTLLAKRVLSKFGLTVITANSGANAIELLKSKEFSVVLMDVHMPDMNGYETTQHIRSLDDEYYKNIPIIALTASVLEDGVEDFKKAGMNDFQLKPFKPDELASKIAQYLKKA